MTSLIPFTFFSARDRPPPDSHNASSHSAIACVFHDDICGKNECDHAKQHKKLRQEVLGCSQGCRNRKNDDLPRARQGVVSRARIKRHSKRVQCRGRAGQGGLAHLFLNEDLVAQLDERRSYLRRGSGVEKHHCERLPSHLRQSSTHAHSSQQQASRCNRARAPTSPETPRQPYTV